MVNHYPRPYRNNLAAKSTKSLCVFVKEFLCVLCVSAVKTIFMMNANKQLLVTYD